jgi:formylglycine-generating enzyme required for sulfatase activity
LALVLGSALAATAAAHAQSALKEVRCPTTSSFDVMVRVGPWCVDKYASVICDSSRGAATRESCISITNQNNGNVVKPSDGEETPDDTLPSKISKQGLILDRNYRAYSMTGLVPTRYVTYYQALAACANAGKQIISDDVWVMAGLGTAPAPDNNGMVNTQCNGDDQGIRATGMAGSTLAGADSCISQFGVEDLFGNLWQWTGTSASFNPGSICVTATDPASCRGHVAGEPMYSLRIDRVPNGHDALSGRWRVGFRCMKPAVQP